MPLPPTITEAVTAWGSRVVELTFSDGLRPVRDWIWLFGLAIAALALEWVWRRRLGLR